ncbi:MAG: hypothetical protein FWG72_00880 [Oscillospiraceae bacterium]|nr:hypothetical protein [Oscillospiraceae bacterium]
MRHLFVINPHSFRTIGSLKRILMDMENCFSVGRRMEYKIYISRRPRDAVAAVRRYLLTVPPQETVRVYAVGGDGILFDCLNGMVRFPNAELTSVPYGSANDFVRAFGDDAAPAFRDIKALSAAPSRPVDVIHCGPNFALIEVNVGLVGQTVIHANTFLRHTNLNRMRRFTPHVYTLAALKSVTNMDIIRQKYTVSIDGEDMSGSYCNIHIANIPCDGGAFVPSPYAVPDDGLLDVIFLSGNRSVDVIKRIGDRNSGHFEKHTAFVYKKCRTVTIQSDLQLCTQMDGEAFYTHEVTLEIIPGGIKFFAPQGLDFADYSHRAYRKEKGGGNHG